MGSEGHVIFANLCDTPVSVLFRTDHSLCASRADAKYPCFTSLRELGDESFSGLLIEHGAEAGRFYWVECTGRHTPVEVRHGMVECVHVPKGSILPDSHPYLR